MCWKQVFDKARHVSPIVVGCVKGPVFYMSDSNTYTIECSQKTTSTYTETGLLYQRPAIPRRVAWKLKDESTRLVSAQ